MDTRTTKKGRRYRRWTEGSTTTSPMPIFGLRFRTEAGGDGGDGEDNVKQVGVFRSPSKHALPFH